MGWLGLCITAGRRWAAALGAFCRHTGVLARMQEGCWQKVSRREFFLLLFFFFNIYIHAHRCVCVGICLYLETAWFLHFICGRSVTFFFNLCLLTGEAWMQAMFFKFFLCAGKLGLHESSHYGFQGVCVCVCVQGAMDVVLAWAPLANSWRLGMRAFWCRLWASSWPWQLTTTALCKNLWFSPQPPSCVQHRSVPIFFSPSTAELELGGQVIRVLLQHWRVGDGQPFDLILFMASSSPLGRKQHACTWEWRGLWGKSVGFFFLLLWSFFCGFFYYYFILVFGGVGPFVLWEKVNHSA